MPTLPQEPQEKDSPVEKIDIKQMMTPEEFNETGLSRLLSDELQKLDAWLNMNRGKLGPGPRNE